MIKRELKNLVEDHLSRLEKLSITHVDTPWFIDITNNIIAKIIPKGLTWHQKNKFFPYTKSYFWDVPYLFKEGNDGILRICIPYENVESFLHHYHILEYRDHFRSTRTTSKILQSSFYRPNIFKDAILC